MYQLVFFFSKPSHLCATSQSTLIQVSTCSTHLSKYQGLQTLTVTQSVEHILGKGLPFMNGVVHIKTNCPVVFVSWEGWACQTKPSTDSNFTLVHHQVLFDLGNDIYFLPATAPPFLVISHYWNEFCWLGSGLSPWSQYEQGKNITYTNIP